MTLFAHEVDIIVFSYDRPLQLYAFLESLYGHSSHIRQTAVLYRTSTQEYQTAYKKLFEIFPQVRFIEQHNPPHDFKPLLIEELFQAESSKHIAFAVDDLIITGEINFHECIEALESFGAYGFYLRLGRNIDDCWSSNHYEGTPPLKKMGERIDSWIFETGQGNWAYPNTVDMTIYRKKDIETHFKNNDFFHPNSLEDHFGIANLALMGLCYETSKVVNIPLNIISETTETRHLNLSTRELLDLFNTGLKIDIIPLFQYKNRSAHLFAYTPTFVPRNPQ